MLCPRCHGKHFFLKEGRMLPCPECGGFGEVHCCDGLQAQPEGPPAPCADQSPATAARTATEE